MGDCELEASANMSRKRPERLDRLAEVLGVAAVEDVGHERYSQWAATLVAGTDIHVLAAARTLAADVLVTAT